MPLAVQHIRRMRGGAQSQMMRCDDGFYYIVKFQNNPQHVRVLANEMLATRLAALLGLPVPAVAVIEVRAELIANSEELVIELGRKRTPCAAGRQFGSRYPGDPARLVVHDFLPDQQLSGVHNLQDFLGMLVFDKWTCNTNGRQAIFFRPNGSGYQARMVDQGFCFNAADWSFPDAPLRGLYFRQRVYETVRGMESFAPWLARLENKVNESVLDEMAGQIPPEWYSGDHDALFLLLERLHRRRRRVPELLLETRNSTRQPFPHWT